MNYKDYLNKRNQLISAAQALINEGKLDEFNAKKKEIETLDNEYKTATKDNADFNALNKSGAIVNVANLSANVTGTVIDKTENKDSQELYNVAFGKYLLNRSMTDDEKHTFNLMNATQRTNDHTVVIPETYVKGIWSEMAERHPIIADTTSTRVEGHLVIRTGSMDSGANWYDETTPVTDGSVQTAEITLKGYELAKAVTVSWLLKDMSIDEFIPFITSKIAEVMGNALANALVNGLGVPSGGDTFKAQPKGVVTALKAQSQTPQIVTYSDVDPLGYRSLTSAVALIKSGYLSGSSIYAKNKTIWNVLANLLDEIGRPLFIPDVTSGGVGRMFGLTVKEEDAVKENDILIGNMAKGYAFNVNKNIAIYTEDHVKARETDYMGYAVMDGSPLTMNAFAYIEKS